MNMTAEHKKALAEGRQQAKAIKSYLAALGSRRPGRPVTRESLQSKIDKLTKQISSETDPLKSVELVQRRLDAEDALAGIADSQDFSEVENGFVDAALPYSTRKGISYSAWREAGVPAEVLRRAGVPRTRRG